MKPLILEKSVKLLNNLNVAVMTIILVGVDITVSTSFSMVSKEMVAMNFSRIVAYIFVTLMCSSCLDESKLEHRELSKKTDNRPLDAYGQRYVVGYLGNKKVNIPSTIGGIVEYSGSPFWSNTKNRIPRSQRTYDDAIVSFGFEMRIDGMLHHKYYKTPAESRIAYEKEYHTPQSQWLDIGILANDNYSYYYGFIGFDEYLRRLESNKSNPWFRSELQDEKLYGLYVFLRPDIIDHNTGKSWREDEVSDTVTYVSVRDGIVHTVIDCSINSRYELAKSCIQRFSLDPEWKTEIFVRYRIALLPKWEEIESVIKTQMNEFIVN